LKSASYTAFTAFTAFCYFKVLEPGSDNKVREPCESCETRAEHPILKSNGHKAETPKQTRKSNLSLNLKEESNGCGLRHTSPHQGEGVFF